MTDPWTELRQAATLGTARASLPPSDDPTLAALPKRDSPEAALLDRAALLGAMRAAGRRSVTAQGALPEPAPPETTPPAPERAAFLLGSLLDRLPLLLEWLESCRAAGCHLPPRWLPELLDRTEHSPELRPALRSVLGERGTWLARQNPAWRFALPAGLPSEEAWEAATPAVREELFRAAREADPDGARDLLRRRWPTERADTRGRLLAVLAQTATDEDAALADLLEGALGDRSQDVRRGARRLLARLPGTPFQARMEARLRALVHLPPEASGLARLNPLRERRAKLNAYVPDEHSERDGLPGAEGKPGEALTALLGLMHPRTALAVLGPDAATAVQRARDLKATDALRAAHSNAPGGGLALELARGRDATDLIAALPPAEQEARALAWLANASGWDEFHRGPLAHLPPPWSPRLSAAVFGALARSLPGARQARGYDRHWYGWTGLTAFVALRADLNTPLPELPAGALDEARPPWQDLAATLRTRRDIQTSFKEPA